MFSRVENRFWRNRFNEKFGRVRSALGRLGAFTILERLGWLHAYGRYLAAYVSRKPPSA
jgi:hypothetical protein